MACCYRQRYYYGRRNQSKNKTANLYNLMGYRQRYYMTVYYGDLWIIWYVMVGLLFLRFESKLTLKRYTDRVSLINCAENNNQISLVHSNHFNSPQKK